MVEEVRDSAQVDDGWIIAPAQQTRDVMNGQIRERTNGAHEAGLPTTQTFEFANSTREYHVALHLWSLSFFPGMRMIATSREGFLDATSTTPGKLVDFMRHRQSLKRGVRRADEFWMLNWQ